MKTRFTLIGKSWMQYPPSSTLRSEAEYAEQCENRVNAGKPAPDVGVAGEDRRDYGDWRIHENHLRARCVSTPADVNFASDISVAGSFLISPASTRPVTSSRGLRNQADVAQ